MKTKNIRQLAVIISLLTCLSASSAYGVLNNMPGEAFEKDNMLFYIDPDTQKCSLIDFFYLENEDYKSYDNTIWGNYTNNREWLKWFDIIDYSGDIEIPSEVEYNGTLYNVEEVRCWITGYFKTKETKNLVIPGSVKMIQGFMKGNFESLEIQEGTEFIAGFNYVTIKDLYLPASLTTLKRYSFVNIYGLEEFSFPPLIETVEDNIVIDCPDLKVLKMNNARKVSGTVGYKLPQLTTLDLGNVEVLEGHSFSYLNSLEVLTIPETTQKIGPDCFSNIPNLKVLHLPSHPIELDHDFNTTGVQVIYARCAQPYDLNGSFSGSNPKSQIKIYVPGGSGEAYRAHPDWNNLGEIIEDYTGVENVSVEKFEARGGSGFIEVAVTPVAEVAIYATDGRIVSTRMIDGTGKIEVAAGAYIVKCGQETAKVIVR